MRAAAAAREDGGGERRTEESGRDVDELHGVGVVVEDEPAALCARASLGGVLAVPLDAEKFAAEDLDLVRRVCAGGRRGQGEGAREGARLSGSTRTELRRLADTAVPAAAVAAVAHGCHGRVAGKLDPHGAAVACHFLGGHLGRRAVGELMGSEMRPVHSRRHKETCCRCCS